MKGFTIFESNVKCWQTKEKRTEKDILGLLS